MDVSEVAERLYGLRPEEFTAARDSEVKRARAEGDREAASAIAGLRRPSLAAWLVNVLVRHRADEVEQLIALGEALRSAQQGLAGDQVRALGRQRQQVLAAVGRQARALARELGHPVSDDVGLEVEQTLGAAMADPAIAEAVRSGRLTSPTSYAGLGALPEGPASARPLAAVPASAPAARTARGPDADEQVRRREEEARRREAERRAAELEQARREADEAQQAYEAAVATAHAADERHDEAERAVGAAQARVEELQEELRRAEEEVLAAGKSERSLRREHETAARMADLATRALQRARERVTRLG